ncbi:hypothetical protein E2C01_055052 [Portunus trituberculatus]|uniref:Uncharacterized protein n=1 Tax=Portunus trituberculatus TaxID=210409 RepID=A0A5B7GLA8_PORTR|nr:hypothetical protein [Portunus trituberculatus]
MALSNPLHDIPVILTEEIQVSVNCIMVQMMYLMPPTMLLTSSRIWTHFSIKRQPLPSARTSFGNFEWQVVDFTLTTTEGTSTIPHCRVTIPVQCGDGIEVLALKLQMGGLPLLVY